MSTEEQSPLRPDPDAHHDAPPPEVLEDIVNRYMEELAEGRQPDPSAYIRAHPELAEELRSVFKTLDLIEAAGKSLNAAKLEGGLRLGEFRIIREIGRGGMGVVYEAEQTSLGRRVALKVLPVEVMLSENARERFQREAHTAGRLHHTNIVPIYAVGEDRGICYYAMQYIEGRSLGHYLKTIRDTPRKVERDHFRRIARWGRQAAEALAYAHDQGVIHRDVKPANLLLDTKDNVWVFDFGLARLESASTITQSGDMLGTLRYMAPEQVGGRKGELDARADIYALGATLYEMASFSPAFDEESRAGLMHKVMHTEPRPLRQVLPSVPRDLETIISKCMRKNRAERYQHASEVAEDLRRFLAREPICARPIPWYVKATRLVRKHRAYATAAAAVVLLLVASTILTLKLRRDEGLRCLNDAYTAIMMDLEYARGDELLDRAESLGIDSPELHLYRGLIPLMNQQPHLAIEHIEKAEHLDPGGLCVSYALARARIDTGRFNVGQRLFELEGTRRPNTALGWFLRGYARSRHQPAEAIACYSRALELQPDFVPAILERATWRGVRLLTEGAREDLDAMLSDCDAVVVFRPNSALCYAWRAWAWLAAAAYAGTQADLQQEREVWLSNCRLDLDRAEQLLKGGDARVHITRGAYLRFIGDYDEAAAAYERAMSLHKRRWGRPSTMLQHAHAIVLHAKGDLAAALDETIAASETAPEFYSLMLHQAVLLAELDRLSEARAVCRRSMELQQLHATGLLMSAAVMELLGGADEAAAAVAALDARDADAVSSEHLLRTVGSEPPDSADAAKLDYMMHRCDAAALMREAGDNPERRCEYAFLVALRKLGGGRREAGLSMLRVSLETGIFFYGEHRFSCVFLVRADADPDWPRWVDRKAGNPSPYPFFP